MTNTPSLARVYIGIDPGVGGAIATLPALPETPTWSKTPTMTLGPRKVIDGAALWHLLNPGSTPPAAIAIEIVHAMPKQGVSSTFTFGCAFGAALALAQATGARIHALRTDQWRAAVGLPKTASKDDAIALALRLWPALSVGRNHNAAEALLLAEAARRIDAG